MQDNDDIYVKIAMHYQDRAMLSLEVSSLQTKLQQLTLEATKSNLITIQVLSELSLIQSDLDQETAKFTAKILKELGLPDQDMEKYKEFLDITKIQEKSAQVEEQQENIKKLLGEIQELRTGLKKYTSERAGKVKGIQEGVKEVEDLFNELSK